MLGAERRCEAREIAEDPENGPGRRERGDAAAPRKAVGADLLDVDVRVEDAGAGYMHGFELVSGRRGDASASA